MAEALLDDQVGEELLRVRAENADLKGSLNEALSDLRLLRSRNIADNVDELARIRTLLHKGNAAEAKYQLERFLSHLDSAWRTRA